MSRAALVTGPAVAELDAARVGQWAPEFFRASRGCCLKGVQQASPCAFSISCPASDTTHPSSMTFAAPDPPPPSAHWTHPCYPPAWGTPAPPVHQHADGVARPRGGRSSRRSCRRAVVLRQAERRQFPWPHARCSLPFSDAGVHAAKWLKFPRPGEHLRHLVLVRPRDQAATATVMHTTRLQSMDAAMRQWGCFSLSHVGRLYTAKHGLLSRAVRPPGACPMTGDGQLLACCVAARRLMAASALRTYRRSCSTHSSPLPACSPSTAFKQQSTSARRSRGCKPRSSRACCTPAANH